MRIAKSTDGSQYRSMSLGGRLEFLEGDCLDILPILEAGSVQCCVTSPPYWRLRDYGCNGQLGLEATPEEYVANLVAVFREVWRVLKDDGTLWVNMGDSYSGGKTGRNDNNPADLARRAIAYGTGTGNGCGPRNGKQRPVPDGLKPKDLCGIPWRLAFALQADGWYLRSDIIWHKPNPMPESCTDRPTKSHEYIFLLSKQERYFYDAEAIREPATEDRFRKHPNGYPYKPEHKQQEPGNGNRNNHSWNAAKTQLVDCRNKRTVWTVATQPYAEAHFATFPEDLIKPCIMAGSRIGDTILDPFGGSGTTGLVALELGRRALLIELNPKYIELIHQRTNVTAGML